MPTLINYETKTAESNLLLQKNIPAHSFSASAILKMEKEVLGIYVSSHPLSIYRKKLSKYLPSGYLYIKSNQIEQVRHGQRICIAGLLIQVRRQFTKNRELMAFLLLEDEIGLFEAIAFPQTFHSYFSLLIKDALLVIEGNTSNKSREEKIITNKISNINSICRENKL